MRLDLNADVGESFGEYKLGQDGLLMPSITSASIACGFHAGDPGVMRETIALARQHGVAVGAHPSFPDLVGFGRREMRATPREVEDFVVYQIGALAAVAAAAGHAPPAREGRMARSTTWPSVTRPLRTPSHAQPPQSIAR